jgi:hypothetical protein
LSAGRPPRPHGRYLLIGMFCLSGMACGGAPMSSSSDVSGTWIGASSTTLGPETITAVIGQSGSTLSGTWSWVFADAPSDNSNVPLSGTITGTNVSLTLPFGSEAGCQIAYTAALGGGTSMVGTLSETCPPYSQESLTLMKQ